MMIKMVIKLIIKILWTIIDLYKPIIFYNILIINLFAILSLSKNQPTGKNNHCSKKVSLCYILSFFCSYNFTFISFFILMLFCT